MKNSSLLIVVTGLVLLTMLGWAAMILLAPAEPVVEDERDLARQVAVLSEAIAGLIDAQPGAGGGEKPGRRTPAAGSPAGGQTPGGSHALREILDATDAERLADALDKLTAAVARQNELLEEMARRGGGGTASLERIEQGKTEADWEAWKPVIELWHESPERARQSLQLLTAEEVMSRYGPPTKVYGHTGGMRWSYLKDYDPRTGDTTGEVFLTFNAGYLTDLAITSL